MGACPNCERTHNDDVRHLGKCMCICHTPEGLRQRTEERMRRLGIPKGLGLPSHPPVTRTEGADPRTEDQSPSDEPPLDHEP